MNTSAASSSDRAEAQPASLAEPQLSELARRGTEMLEGQVLPLLARDDDGKFVAPDVMTGDFEVDPRDYLAIRRLRGRRPDAKSWLGRVGHATAYRMGRG